MRPRWPVVLPAVIAAALALAARWEWAATPQGPRFLPRPDALEYAAAAQAIARSGDYLLQIGPHRVRPRYPPGWPLLLAAAVGLGVEGDALWRVTGLFGAALAALLAALAAWAVQRLAGGAAASAGGPVPWIDLAAAAGGLTAGIAWALAPLAVTAGRTVMSDEPAACAAAVALAAFAGGLLGRRPRPLLLAAGGLALGALATIRTVEAALLAIPLVLLAAGGLRRSGAAALHGLGWAVLGAAAAPALAALILARSGLPPWRWSGYDLWVPARYASLGDAFRLEYALAGSPDMPSEGHRMPHLELAARVLAGMPGLRRQSAIGRLWPAAAWVAGALVLARAARGGHGDPGECRGLPPSPAPERSPKALRHPPTARATSRRRRGGKPSLQPPRAVPWLAAALLVWAAAHTALFALYFFSAPRFHLPVAALCPLAMGTAVGLGLAVSRPPVRALAAAAAMLVAAVVGLDFACFRSEPLPLPPPEPDVRAAFTAWSALPPAARAAGTVSFDPVHAQALGLLGPRAVATIGADWGELPPTRHVRRLRARGMIPR